MKKILFLLFTSCFSLASPWSSGPRNCPGPKNGAGPGRPWFTASKQFHRKFGSPIPRLSYHIAPPSPPQNPKPPPNPLRIFRAAAEAEPRRRELLFLPPPPIYWIGVECRSIWTDWFLSLVSPNLLGFVPLWSSLFRSFPWAIESKSSFWRVLCRKTISA